MNQLCIDCDGRRLGHCLYCHADDDPRGGDYDEDEFADEAPERDEEEGEDEVNNE